MKKYIVIIPMLLVMATGCTESCTNKDPKLDRYTLHLHLVAEPDTLNPITATDAYSTIINSDIYETLLERDKDTLQLKPKLATHWKISPNKLSFTFYIKKGIKWSDGKELTADDIVYSFERIKDPKVLCPALKVYYTDVKNIRKIDAYTVEFICLRPNFQALGSCGDMPIVPKHIFDNGTDFNSHKNNRNPIGTGPFLFKEWITNRQIILIRNEKYWGPQPVIKRIVYTLVSEQYIALEMLKKGDLDYVGLRPIQWVRQTGSDTFQNKFYKLQYYKPNYSYIGWNSRKPYFSDKRVRRALTQLINREEILQKLSYGLGKQVTGNFFIFSDSYNKKIKPWPYDRKAARKLLKEAGWTDTDNDGILDKNGKKFSFVFMITSGSVFPERFASILKEDLSKEGIEVSIHRFEWAVFLSKIHNRDFDATILSWSLGYSGDPYQLWHSSQVDKGSNYCAFINKEADAIIENARGEFNSLKRTKMYQRFHEIIHEEQPYTFLYCSSSLVAVSKRFDGVKVHTRGLDYLEWKVKE